MAPEPKWLHNYATDRHDWHNTTSRGRTLFFRRLGIVESLFDVDGSDFEGRADLTMHLHVEIRTCSTLQVLRERILQAWSILRQEHVLLSTSVAEAHEVVPEDSSYDAHERLFVFEPNRDADDMLAEARKHTIFLDDHYPEINADNFFIHALNSSRGLNASTALSRLYVMPTEMDTHGLCQLHLVLIAAHQISDGLSFQRWMANFIDHLNQTPEQLRRSANDLCGTSPAKRLPPAQESLYPPIKGNKARQRWSWLLSRILRHTRRPPPASFQNPLRRRDPLPSARATDPRFSKVLDYTHTPPLNTFPIRAVLGPESTKKLARICRQAKISVGSGCFALVAMVMMLFEEMRNPHVSSHERLPFVGSFPINPRPFLTASPTTGKEDSLILAFSDGVTLPYLPSDLDFEGRLRLLGKQAARQLRQYQKRLRSLEEEVHLGSKSPTQLFPLLYLSTLERLESRTKVERKRGWDVQGEYPAKLGATPATCGVSSVGARSSVISSGKYDTGKLPPGHDVVADFRNLNTTVRARDGEFLVGVVGDGDYLRFQVSYDGCAIDPSKAEEWKHVLETMLESKETFKMEPDRRAELVDAVQTFSHEDIGRLYRALVCLQENRTELTPINVAREYVKACFEDGHPTSPTDPCIRWLLFLLHLDPGTPLNEKFLDILQEANIILTTDPTETEHETEHEVEHQIEHEIEHEVEYDGASVESVDEDDPRWRQAVALDNQKLGSQALSLWRDTIQEKKEESPSRREIYESTERPILHGFIDEDSITEEDALRAAGGRVFTIPELELRADVLADRKLARKVIIHWRAVTQNVKRMERMADEFRRRKDAEWALKKWVLAAREKLFVRVRNAKAAERALRTWREQTAQIKQMEAVADEFRTFHAAKNTFGKLVTRKKQIDELEAEAVVVYQGNMVRKVLNKWLAEVEHIRRQERRADAAADYFAAKHVMQKLRARAAIKLEEKKYEQARQKYLMRKYSYLWLDAAEKTKRAQEEAKHAQYDSAYKQMRRKVKENIARSALTTWREQTTRIQGLERVADDFRARKDAEGARRLAQRAIVTMYNRTMELRQMEQQADLHYNKNLVKRLEIFGSNWLQPARHYVEQQNVADEYRATRVAGYTLNVLRNWRNNAFRIRRMEEDADMLRQRHDRRRALGFLGKWRRAVPDKEEVDSREERLVPATPAARRSQLLAASTTPAYTPAPGLFGGGRVVEEVDDNE
ncbi:hypothetical protein LTR67_007604 [Exophiala xenobiotica]